MQDVCKTKCAACMRGDKETTRACTMHVGKQQHASNEPPQSHVNRHTCGSPQTPPHALGIATVLTVPHARPQRLHGHVGGIRRLRHQHLQRSQPQLAQSLRALARVVRRQHFVRLQTGSKRAAPVDQGTHGSAAAVVEASGGGRAAAPASPAGPQADARHPRGCCSRGSSSGGGCIAKGAADVDHRERTHCRGASHDPAASGPEHRSARRGSKRMWLLLVQLLLLLLLGDRVHSAACDNQLTDGPADLGACRSCRPFRRAGSGLRRMQHAAGPGRGCGPALRETCATSTSQRLRCCSRPPSSCHGTGRGGRGGGATRAGGLASRGPGGMVSRSRSTRRVACWAVTLVGSRYLLMKCFTNGNYFETLQADTGAVSCRGAAVDRATLPRTRARPLLYPRPARERWGARARQAVPSAPWPGA